MTSEFGAYARRARVYKRVSLEEVAQQLGYSAVYISDIERGNRNPVSNDKLVKWAELIDVNPAEFVDKAEMERGGVELPLNSDLGATRNELALALARAWPDLTPEEEKDLKSALSERLNQARQT